MLVARIQHWEDIADQTLTFAGQPALPLVVLQTFHLVCPFQPCVVSAELSFNQMQLMYIIWQIIVNITQGRKCNGVSI